MNGPLKFLTARKILPLLDFLAKFKRVLACSCSPNFCVARKLAKQIFYFCSCSQKNSSARHARECSQRPFVTPQNDGEISRNLPRSMTYRERLLRKGRSHSNPWTIWACFSSVAGATVKARYAPPNPRGLHGIHYFPHRDLQLCGPRSLPPSQKSNRPTVRPWESLSFHKCTIDFSLFSFQ